MTSCRLLNTRGKGIYSKWKGLTPPLSPSERILVTSFLFSYTPSEKESALKGKKRICFFSFKIEPFSEGRQIKFDRAASHESVSISLKGTKGHVFRITVIYYLKKLFSFRA